MKTQNISKMCSLFIGVFAISLSSACVTTREEGEQIRQDIALLKGEVAQGQAQRVEEREDQRRALKSFEGRVEDLEETLRGLRQADADNGVQMEKVIAEVQVLRGDIEELQFKLGKTREELEGAKRSVKEILDRPPPTLHTAAEAPSVVDDKKGATCGGETVPKDAQAHYELAKGFFDKSKFVIAIGCFRQFIVVHEKANDLLDNAWFWKGEAHYSFATTLTAKPREKEFKRAILSYQKVLEIPDSNKQDGALLKVGLAFESLGFEEEARVFYAEVVSKYPKSPLAAQAKKRLKSLKDSKKSKEKKSKKRSRGRR